MIRVCNFCGFKTDGWGEAEIHIAEHQADFENNPEKYKGFTKIIMKGNHQ